MNQAVSKAASEEKRHPTKPELTTSSKEIVESEMFLH